LEERFSEADGVYTLLNVMKIALVYSSKEGLLKEYTFRYGIDSPKSEIPADFFAEGDSPETIQAIIEALENKGHQVTGIESDHLLNGQLIDFRPDLVFNIAEGLFGDFRESFVPMICEKYNIPYTGSDPLTLSVCLNKARAKEFLSYYQIPNASFKIFTSQSEISLDKFEFPAIVKPVSEGSSKGIFNDSVVENIIEAKERIREKIEKYNQPVILEKFLKGEEYTVAVWGNGDEIEVLPIVAIQYSSLPVDAHPIYSYEAKWVWDTPENPLEIFQCPAPLSVAQKQKIEKVVCDAYKAMQIRDWCRIDIRHDEDGVPNILELNPLPGILPNQEDNSCFPKAARTAGYNYAEMLNRVVQFAAKRYGIRS
jgi:D-alanine-D-alanine ligase